MTKFFVLLLLFSAQAFAQNCAPEQLRIALDIGHSPEKSGALSARGVNEYEYNKKLTGLLHRQLLDAGFAETFIITADNPNMPLHARTSLANARKADVLLSIHHDSVQEHYLSSWTYEGRKNRYSDRFSGYSLFTSEKNGDFQSSRRLADSIGKELLRARFHPTLHHAEAIKGENRPLLDPEKGIYRYDDLIILKNTKMPAVLLECGVILNRDEEILLRSPVYQHALLDAVVKALRFYAAQWGRQNNTRCAEDARAETVSAYPKAQHLGQKGGVIFLTRSNKP